MYRCRIFAVSALAFALSAAPLVAQSSSASRPQQTAVALHPSLLPATFDAYTALPGSSGSAPEPAYSLNNANREALEECGPVRSAVQDYAGKTAAARVEAVEFKDASGALAAYSLLVQPGMRELKGVGAAASQDAKGVVFLEGAAVAVVFPAPDVHALQALANVMPKPVGAQAQQPLLPSLLPARGLVAGSVRYAMGQATYMAEGGVLPAAGLGWDKDAEAITAKYSDRRGAETLTLLLYPTPTIAGPHLREIEAQLSGLGPSFRGAKARREGALVVLANGTFSADAAQALAENTHLHQFASTDKATPTPETVETRKTFGLLANVILFSGVLGSAAILLGLFLGGGRALIRVMRGKSAATEAEFLSLHLDPQNPLPVFSKD